MAREMNMTPTEVPCVNTEHRRISTKIPVPGSLNILETLREREPLSMRGQALVVWHKAKDHYIQDPWGNKWIDWSSGVLIANVGHNHPRIISAIRDYIDTGAPLATYCFAHEPRAVLVERLSKIAPAGLDTVFLLSTGSEATEAAMKLARTHGLRTNAGKGYLVSHKNAFHGRTLAAQFAGGALGGGEWVTNIDPNHQFVQVPYPAEPGQDPLGFDSFVFSLDSQGIQPKNVAGVICETFPGRNATLMPQQYAQDLREWCNRHDVVLIIDEVQAGFGRTGKLFGFEHYGIVPDLVCCGKGISSSLPLSALIGSSRLLDQYGIHQMTSTHSGSPLPVIAATASLEALLENDRALIRNAAKTGKYLGEQLAKTTKRYGSRITVGGIGLVYAMQFWNEGKPDAATADDFWEQAVYGGNMFFAPVGIGGATIKFCPPLCMNRETIDDGFYGPYGIASVLDRVMRK